MTPRTVPKGAWPGGEGPLLDPPVIAGARSRVPYAKLLLSPTFIGCTLACFGAYWSLSLGLTWSTPFIVKGLGFSQQSAGWLATLPWVIGALTVISAGVASQALVGRGVSTRAADPGVNVPAGTPQCKAAG